MTTTRFGRGQKAVALVPLALLSTAWTASLVGVGGTAVAITADDDRGALPDGGSVPATAFEDPASYSRPGSIGLGVPESQAASIVNTSSTNGIPAAALAAYQRAATVINSADKSCNIDWQLLGAIGRVESDHGRFGGNTLGTDGVSRPGIYGIPLDGSNNTQKISDTDAGQFDNDQVYDRAVGPMQFVPSTWTAVGVDADGDGVRDPQNINDAALASAVYLCSGSDDLGTDEGRRAAVFRYNHSEKYVDLVLRIRDAYLSGDYSAVPNNTTSAISFTPDYTLASPNLGSQVATRPPKAADNANNGSNPGTPTTPTDPGTDDSDNPTTPGTPNVPSLPTNPLKDVTKPLEDVVKPGIETVETIVNEALAKTICNEQLTGLNALLRPACQLLIVNKPLSTVTNLIFSLLNGGK
ncbi:lytic transglycosylase domain-containing protein [Nocardioides daejeonensis]|uniref:lytic transglycosylase domain-containing protein n=1 Tax=Nocardioides daejeonensis TaxID=1046556 RepID=UPI000D74BC46|nr:lytic transglycosylase domain-containing protein [Nocardioides daejeonensis]